MEERFDISVEIQGRGWVDLMVLKVDIEDIESNVDREQKVFFLMRHV